MGNTLASQCSVHSSPSASASLSNFGGNIHGKPESKCALDEVMAEGSLAERYLAYERCLHRYSASRDEALLRTAFHLLDLNGDGLVSKNEQLTYGRVLEEEDLAKARTAELFRIGDTDADGFLNEDEYVRLLAPIITNEAYYSAKSEPDVTLLLDSFRVSRNPVLLEMVFHLLDSNNDHRITLNELNTPEMLALFPGQSAKHILKQGDENRDGWLSIEEFVRLVQAGIDEDS